MSPSETRVAAAFDHLRAIAHDQREHLLASDSTLDGGERDQVRDLLAHDSPTEVFMGQPLRRVAAGLVEPLIDGPAPASIGQYRIIRPIARGSFGAVYLARQSHPERDVAIKLLPFGADEAARRRFEFEAAALARLNHPNVAAVLELVFEADRPCIVMEYVDGIALDFHATQHQLSIPQRVALLRQVCDGVAHIHQRGVLHRDLAPKNILVTKDGVPKIVDFGLACDAAADLNSAQRLTLPGSVVGTLRYISPEQLAGRAEVIDESSDTYALGVIAFELLTGSHPYLAANVGLADAVRQLQDAPLRLEAAKLGPLGSDLQAVLAKAVEREPGRRYAGPAVLAEDLRCALANLPVSAVRAGRLYRLQKLYARKRGTVWAGGVAAVIIAASVINAGVSLHREARNRESALHALDIVVTRLLSPLGPRIGTLEERERLLADIEPDVLAMKPQTSRDPRVVKVYAGLRTAQSDIHRDRARNELSLAAIAEGVKAWEELYDLTEQDLAIGHEYSIAMVKHGDALARLDRAQDSVAEYRRVLEMDESLVGRSPGDLGLLSNLFWSQLRIAEMAGQTPEGRAASIADADDTARRMIELAPEEWRSLDAYVQACLYRARAAGVATPEGVAALVEAERAAGRLIEIDPAATVHRSAYLRVLSHLLAARGQSTQAVDFQPYVERALAIERSLAANTGESRYEDSDLISFYDQLARASLDAGQYEAAIRECDKAVVYAARRMAGGYGVPHDAVAQANLLAGRRLQALRALGRANALEETIAALAKVQSDLDTRFAGHAGVAAAAIHIRSIRESLSQEQASASR